MGVAVELRHDGALEPVHELGKLPTPGSVCLSVAAAHVHQDEDLLAVLLRARQLAGQPLQLVARVGPVVNQPAEMSSRIIKRFSGSDKLRTN